MHRPNLIKATSIFILLSLTWLDAMSQKAFDNRETPIQSTTNSGSREIQISELIKGSLLVPNPTEKSPLAIIIGGSGPTDRNGNQPMMTNNSLKYLAEGLSQRGIASFRYDKRIIPLIQMGTFQEQDVRFNDFINDARKVLLYFNSSDAFGPIYLIGHSQGSLVGMIAAKDGADGFISIAGAGQSIDQVVLDQLAIQLPSAVPGAESAFQKLAKDGSVEQYPLELSTIFRPSIQRFMFEWMQYDPAESLSTLSMPTLIINGTSDLQVSEEEAMRLKAKTPQAEFELILNMNHVLKIIEEKGLANGKSYNDPNLPVSERLLEIIVRFIEENSSKEP